MSVNEEGRQVEIAAEVEELTRTLAHSTRAVPRPSDSYPLLGELTASVDHLAQVIAQLAKWHYRVEDGVHYDGEDGGSTASATSAGAALDAAAHALTEASEHIGQAHSSNAVVRWYDEPRASIEA